VFDFRYHALSLIAVLVALVLGLLLGVAIGDKGLVSSAENNIKESLRADVRAAQKRADALSNQLTQQAKFEKEVYPLLVDGQLTDRKIGVVFLGQPSDEINTEVQNALDPSGGKRVGAVVVREPLAAGDLAGRAKGTRYEGLATGDDALWEEFGVRMGVQLTTPAASWSRPSGAGSSARSRARSGPTTGSSSTVTRPMASRATICAASPRSSAASCVA
jgi:hypothetical protein